MEVGLRAVCVDSAVRETVLDKEAALSTRSSQAPREGGSGVPGVGEGSRAH